uniref:IRS-type PTB domain-containing protein n=1 Tax=Loa loa TaxID=7209 RepID=A0A1I7VYZ8_LOALO
MVGSQGYIRQDIVFAIICERVDELYPWHGIPTGIAELEREDCYYSHLFDPVVDTESLYTCRSREYISGITRLSDTRVQVLCCRLRTRDEINCIEKEFTKPFGSDLRTEIYHHKQIINSIAIEGHNYRVRFCDLTPRAIGLIYDDLPVTVATTTETPKNRKLHALESESKVFDIATAKDTKNGRLTSQTTTVSSATGHVIQIFRPSSLYNFEEVQNILNMSTLSPSRNDYSQNIEPSLEAQQMSEGKFLTAMDAEEKDQSTDWVTDEISKQNSTTPTVSFIPAKVMQIIESRHIAVMMPHQQFQSAMPEEEVVSNNHNQKTVTWSYFAESSLQTTTSASLILLKPLSSKSLHTKVTPGSKPPTTKTSTRRRMKQTLNTIISTTSSKTTLQSTTTSTSRFIEHEHTSESPFLSSDQLLRAFSSGAHIDEETKYSPFENKDNNPSRDNQAIGSEYSLLHTSANPLDTTLAESDAFPYKISNEIRRAPIKSQDNGLDYTEYDLLMKKSGDGSRTYVPEKPLDAPSAAIVYDANKQNDVFGIAKRKKEVQQRDQESDQEHKDVVSKELLPMNDDEVTLVSTDVFTPSSVKPSSTASSEQDDLEFPTTNFSQIGLEKTAENVYDPSKFYRTPPPKRPTQTEKVLTFCTKEIAIRDRHNLVIACGSETEIWQPFRCPEGSECFFSADSSYRICCAVAEAVRYAQ